MDVWYRRKKQIALENAKAKDETIKILTSNFVQIIFA